MIIAVTDHDHSAGWAPKLVSLDQPLPTIKARFRGQEGPFIVEVCCADHPLAVMMGEGRGQELGR